jgi:hypothetical protein
MKKNNNIGEKIARLEEKLIASEKALNVANESMQSRLATMNEFRDQLKDQAARFVTRDELMLLIKPICEDIQDLRESRAMLEGKANQSSVNKVMLVAIIGLGISFLNTVISIVIYLLK